MMWLGLTVVLGTLLSTALFCPRNCICDVGSADCQSCIDGYYSGYALNTYYHYCRWECPKNCIQCALKLNPIIPTCSKCRHGYYLAALNTKCRKCKQNCVKCSDKHDCSECKNGYYLPVSSTECRRCLGNCKTCSNQYICSECKDGYYTRTPYTDCRKCNPNCRKCSDQYSCSECKDGYYNARTSTSRLCQHSCLSNCKRCTDSNTCTHCHSNVVGPQCDRCQDGYYGNYCDSPCKSTCAACISFDKCTSCPLGYTGALCNVCDNGKYGTYCNTYCPVSCQTCTSDNYCLTCKAGYTGNTCQYCIPGKYGIQCDKDCPFGCNDGACYRYNGHCQQCKEWFEGNKCESCEAGRYGSQCDLFCPSNCKDIHCHKDLGVCFSCTPQHHGSYCNQYCPANCLSCFSAQLCITCKRGQYGVTCNEKCPVNCQNSSCHKDSGYCKEGCIDNYHGDKCKETCPEHCATCRSSTHCFTCEVGFKGYTCRDSCGHCSPGTGCKITNGQCHEGCSDGYYGSTCSEQCNSECKTCKTRQQDCESCIQGKYGKYVNRDALKCDKVCPKYCLNNICHPDKGNCLACVDGYTGDKCDRCPEHCQTCSSPGVCTRCKAGYINLDKQCTCTKDICTTDMCSECTNATWYVDKTSGSCCECSRNCKSRECSTANRCANGCVTGSYGEYCGHSCSSKDRKCIECESVGDQYTGCKECMLGFYPSEANGTCIACNDACANNTCSSSNGHCLQGCLDTFWGEICNKTCAQNCLKCDRKSADCLECSGGNYWKDCSKNCSRTCNETDIMLICDVKDGNCLHGCTNNTLHGPQCEHKCSSGCLQEECDWQTGRCLRGCKDNAYGETCATECSNECGNVTSGKRCLAKNGSCVNDCLAGFYGDRCDVKCSEHCVNVTCSRDGGVCGGGCVDGYVSGTCTHVAEQTVDPDNNVAAVGVAVGCVILLIIGLVVLVILLRRRKQRNQKANTGSTTSQETRAGRQEGAGSGGQEGAGVESIPLSPFVPRAGPSSGATCSNVSESAQLYAVPEKRTTYPVYSTPVKDQSHGQRPFSRAGNQAKDAVKQHAQHNSTSNKYTDADKDTPVYANNAKVGIAETTFGAAAAHVNVTFADGRDKAIHDEEEIDEDMVPPVTSGTDNDVYYNTFSAGIAVEKLQHYVANTWTQGFDREFQQLPYGLKQPYDDSQKPENTSKNRYKGIYPYDESRVRLAGPGSDYINACYIDGFQHDKAYIASLGPTEKTMPGYVDFWRMVWQNNVEKIVMLTNLYENGAMKCEQYWPEHGTSVTYGDVTVTCHSEDTYAEYTVRTFTVAKGPDTRSLHHIHFTAWPDKGVPDDVTGLIEFRQKVESWGTKLNGPMIVHCSAGVGRTGTYIALDILTKQGQKDLAVNIYGCVMNMREQRVFMVQTKEQYHYLHQAVVHALTFDSEAIQGEQFQQRLAAMKDGHLVTQFQQLQKTCVHLSEEETDAVKTNKSRDQYNRKGADIPGNLYRPRLTKQESSSSSDYINAVYINSFTRSSHYITAQTPLPNTMTDFLTLIDQYNCVCIVSMDPDQLKYKSVGVYLPGEHKSVKHGPYTVTSGRIETGHSYNVRKLTLSQQGHGSPVEKTLSHFQLTQWSNTDPTPGDAGKFVELIKKVESSATETDPNGRILVHCLTGAERSGLFCVVSVLIQKMEIEHQVSVVNTVRQVKSRRMLAIPNKEQYIFCHDCVDAYLKTFDIYSNFSAV